MMTGITRRKFTQLVASIAACSASVPLFADKKPPQSLLPYAGPWIPLFNGRDFSNWTFYQDGIGHLDTTGAAIIEDGMIHVLGKGHTGGERPGFGHVATASVYSNYHLRFDFKFGDKRYEPRLLAKRNSGLLYHMFPETDRVWPNAVEFQLEESDVGDAILINTRCWPGNDVGGTPAWPSQVPINPRPEIPRPAEPRAAIERQRVIKNGDFEKIGEWNTIELIAIGDKAAHLVNGRIVTSLFEIMGQDVDDRNIYQPLTSGRIALEIEAAEAFFRNIEIRQFAVGLDRQEI